ncbi:MAG: hypothetical protein PWR10_1572 [Halanaerobiales bacterium]|nr:hypothetical protein [Halanaerobiales bacterium]
MSNKKKIPDSEKYFNFLLNSNLADDLLNEWFNNEPLARAILQMLVKNNLVDYNEVLGYFDYLSREKLRRIMDTKSYDPDSIPLNVDFSTTEEELYKRATMQDADDAYRVFLSAIKKVIPEALQNKYFTNDPVIKNEQKLNNLCDEIYNCTDIQSMFDCFIVADQEVQKDLVAKLILFNRKLIKLKSQYDEIKFPETTIGQIRLFLKDDVKSPELTSL